ncbi:MAG: hypothetical protein M1826_002832 [Phylliscum demangeonii]|nr:MAG: hypothetical protein M1826_002832 [Phylliscum demangeonii]
MRAIPHGATGTVAPGALNPQLLEWPKDHAHDSRMPTIIAVEVFLMAINTVATVARIVATRMSRAALREDDYTLIIAQAGRHGPTQVDVEPWIGDDLPEGDAKPTTLSEPGSVRFRAQAHYEYAYEVVYALCITCIKVSILLLSRRLFVIPRFQRAVDVVNFDIILLGVTMFAWSNKSPANTCCTKTPNFLSATTVLNLFGDLVILVLPMPIVWRLHASWRQKIA